MAGKVVKKAPKRKGANSYKFPESISAGEILTDILKKQWVLGTSIGTGGFGEIYSAAPYSGKSSKEYPNVIKIEPHENGPLFIEVNFYVRNAKSDEIDAWRKKKKLSTFGMPRYIGSGSHEYKNIKYRFLVMDRYGTDLWKLFEENNRLFPEHTVYKIALQIINVIEYIHSKKYVHADIKGANLLLDLRTHDQVYLVDFGLASRYTTKAEYKLDKKRAHNGTIEYTSRDAHMGVPTMRGDFEILGYNMIQWLCGSLLWEKNLNDPAAVQKQKVEAFESISEFLKKSFNRTVPKPVLQYMTLLSSLKFNETPDYEKFTKILIDGLKQLSHKPEGKLEFKSGSIVDKQPILKSTPQKVKKTVERTTRSPRLKLMKNPISVKNLDDSTAGIVIDKKRGGAKDIRQALNDIESDEEYDIKIVKKTKLKKDYNSTNVSNAKREKTPSKTMKKRKTNDHNDSQSNSEEEVISKGTRARPNNTRKRVTTKTRARPEKVYVSKSTSDEDMFDM